MASSDEDERTEGAGGGATPAIGRRDFSLQASASVGAVVVGAGGIGVGFLWPQPPPPPVPVFTCLVGEVPVGDVKEIRSPRGERIYLLRTADTANAEDILAIGSTCSHLGCKVYYAPEAEESRRFHCPCHQGYFDARGNPTAGPPERPLSRYQVEVRGDLVFIEYPSV